MYRTTIENVGKRNGVTVKDYNPVFDLRIKQVKQLKNDYEPNIFKIAIYLIAKLLCLK